MKFLVVLSLAVVCALAAPQGPLTTPIPILRLNLDNDNAGKYNFVYETGNGIVQTQSGQLKNLGGPEGPVQVAQGSYSFVAPDGLTYTVQYTADESGFHAQGAHLPTSPPIPEEIQRSLAANAQEEQRMARPF